MKVIINPAYSQMTTFVNELPSEFSNGGEIVYKARNEIRRYDTTTPPVAVKQYKVPIFINRIVYGLFRPTKAERSYKYALRLQELGIGTPTPIAYIEQYKGGLLSTCYFVSEMATHECLMRHFEFCTLDEKNLHILKAFARFTVELHEKGVHHRDYSPGNILFTEQGEDYDFCLIDINRMQFGTLSRKACLRNFHRMCTRTEVIEILVTEYATLRGWEVAPAVKEALQYREKVLKCKQRKRELKERFRKKKD